MGISPRDLLRTSEPVYRELGLAKGEFTDGEIISLMVENPDLIQRPIVERGDRAVLGRPTEKVKDLPMLNVDGWHEVSSKCGAQPAQGKEPAPAKK